MIGRLNKIRWICETERNISNKVAICTFFFYLRDGKQKQIFRTQHT